MVSNAFVDDKGIVFLVGKRADSFDIYKGLAQNMSLLEDKIKSIVFPRKLHVIEPCDKFPFGALSYLGVSGKEIKLESCAKEQKIEIGKKLAEFLCEMHNTGVCWDKDFSVNHESEKIAKNLKLLKPYFSKAENAHLEKMAKQYNNYLLNSDYTLTHGDLHEENLLVNDKNELVGIIDFGNMAYTPVEFDFAPIYDMDKDIFVATLQNYPKSIDILKVRIVCCFSRSVTFFEYIQDWSKEARLKEVQNIKNSVIFRGA